MADCDCELDLIETECQRSVPGIKTRLRIACTGDLTSIGAATGHAVSTITVPTDMGFYDWYITRKENDYKSTPIEDGGYNTELKGFMSRQDAAKAGILTKANGVENFIVIPEDQNGKKTIIGALDHPCIVLVEAVTRPRNGYNVTVNWNEHADLPLFFTGTVPMATLS